MEPLQEIAEQLAALRAEIAALTARVGRLEEAAAREPSEPVDEETLILISAAVAAYLGKRAPIRRIRLKSSAAWAEQGRASIQASHGLDRNRGR